MTSEKKIKKGKLCAFCLIGRQENSAIIVFLLLISMQIGQFKYEWTALLCSDE